MKTRTTARMARPVPTRRTFTVDEYHCMGRAGILHEDERVELIGGEIIAMAAKGDRHVTCVMRLNFLFNQRLTGRALVSVQDPLRLDDRTEPEPDLVLLRPDPGFYAGRIPTAADALLVVEVTDTTLTYDRRVKLPRYARAGIAEVWIVDLRRRRVLVFRDPAGGEYRDRRVLEPGGTLALHAFPDLVVSHADICGA